MSQPPSLPWHTASPGSNQGSSHATPVSQSPATTPKQNTPSSTPATSRKDPQPVKEGQQDQQAAPAKDSIDNKQGAAQATSLSQRFSKWFGGGESRVQQGTKEDGVNEAGTRVDSLALISGIAGVLGIVWRNDNNNNQFFI